METLTIEVGPSRRLAGLLAGMHGFAAAVFWLAPLPLWLAVSLMSVLLGSAWHTLRRDGFRTLQHSLVALRLDADCRCEFQTRTGAWHEAALLGSSFVAPYLTVLNLKPASGRLVKHLVILPDAVNAEDFRRLRVWLKWRCSKME
ncbi:hypothetical protein SCD_n01388 [Sulfuricella denitrificans skB26]|uniref:Toxin CptA n=1 Tax=Sulfuricella denitrificans (strain DSM 22764 / NBRC 105220 / skB26) TaxID=1163617 RepID=S6AKV5_SULDS|nr:protein YgfX [Sulfuricella denitrificans]BAN35214.1 hypothetical protein SCD_n01388 [Sulfuricella denitrificans skB26]